MGGIIMGIRAFAPGRLALRFGLASREVAPVTVNAATAASKSLRGRLGHMVGGAALQASIDGQVLTHTSAAVASRDAEIARLRQLADFDHLTGLHNRRVGTELLGVDLAHADSPTSAVMIDIDHFKQVNDTHGHRVGDQALQAVADVLRSVAALHGGSSMRLGGEEFALGLPGHDLSAAAAAAEQALQGVRAIAVPLTDGSHLTFTASAGVATRTGLGAEPAAQAVSDMLAAADHNLYAAKAAGRNRVVVS